MRRILLWCLLLLPLAAWAQDGLPLNAPASVVEVDKDPYHHKVLENSYVRVYGVVVPTLNTTQLHHHSKDFLLVVFGPSEVNAVAADGKYQRVIYEDGDVRYFAGGLTHAISNQSVAAFRSANIELLGNQGHPVCVNHCADDPRAKDWPPLNADARVIGYGDNFRITLSTIKPGQTVSTNEPFPHLVLMLTDVHGRSTPPGAKAIDFTSRRGDIMFHDPHPNGNLANAGDQDTRIIEVEFKAQPKPAVKVKP
jgi:hypothetical protein